MGDHRFGNVCQILRKRCHLISLQHPRSWCTACIKVLNWGLGIQENQTAEMVLIWTSFYTKFLIFPSCCRKLEFIVPGSTNHQVELLHYMNLLGNGIIYQMGGIKWVGVSDASTAHETTGHNPIQGSRLLQHSTKKTLQHLYRFQVIRGPQNSKKRTKRGPNFEQKGDPKGAQMETWLSEPPFVIWH